ncbi:SRPBCC family protein [Candidatus Gottesmanbacteria bacterium]|nr:SRPBCC family protein [Candidatus Gottesmanbacteria bacterium]
MKRYSKSIVVSAAPDQVFDYVDDHTRFSSHMSSSSWMMMGGSMHISTDSKLGKEVGSHILMKGSILGIPLFIDEVVTEYKKPSIKSWKTVKIRNLMVVGDYGMKIEILPQAHNSLLRVSIDYDMPNKNKWLGVLLGDWYAKWCVQQMLDGAKKYFIPKT